MPNNTLVEASPASTEAVAVRTHALAKEFAGRLVLHSLDFRVEPGEMVAVVGKSGCGKSTLLRLLCGLEKPSSGWVEIGDERLTGLSRHARLMFQDAALLPWKSVKANVALAAPRNSARDQAAEDALLQVGLGDRAREWPSIL